MGSRALKQKPYKLQLKETQRNQFWSAVLTYLLTWIFSSVFSFFTVYYYSATLKEPHDDDQGSLSLSGAAGSLSQIIILSWNDETGKDRKGTFLLRTLFFVSRLLL